MEKGNNILDCEFIKATYKNYNPENEYNVVFGLDHVICFPTYEEEEVDISNFSKKAFHIQLRFGSFRYSYFFYPYFAEVFLEILSWGWNISFYSNHDAKLDKQLIRTFFLECLRQYMNEPKRLYDKLILDDRIRIFSADKLTSTFTTSHMQTGFDIENFYKIDTQLISQYPSNTIIVEQDRSLILGANYPYIGLDKNASINFSLYFEMILEKLELGFTGSFPKEYLEHNYTPLNNAYYIMGILEIAKNLVATGRAHFLRQALDKVLHNEAYYQNQNKNSKYDTPWYQTPLPHINPKSNELIEIGKNTIAKWEVKLDLHDVAS